MRVKQLQMRQQVLVHRIRLKTSLHNPLHKARIVLLDLQHNQSKKEDL